MLLLDDKKPKKGPQGSNENTIDGSDSVKRMIDNQARMKEKA